MNAEALLVIDVQEEYIAKYEETLLKRINQRIEKAAADSEIIIYIENVKILRHQEKKSSLVAGLHIASSHVFVKEKASAFSNIELIHYLKENEITKIEIVGVDGNSCVCSTAKEGIKYVPNVAVNCDCVGVQNILRFEKTKETLRQLGVNLL